MIARTTSSNLAGVALVVVALAEGGLGSLVSRDHTTTATCLPQYSWLDNQQGRSPCEVAAHFMGPCVGPTYTVPALNDTLMGKYNPPNTTNASTCYCSWAVYNLFSGCVKCQGGQNGILAWAGWSQNCGAYITKDNTYYPPGTPPSNGTTLPYWATVDPTTWTDQRWNEEQALDKANKQPDLVVGQKPTQAPKSSGNIGAIAGGIVGGVTVVAIGVGVALCLFCRHRRRSAPHSNASNSTMIDSQFGFQHGRSPSDFSTKSYGSGLGYSQLRHTSSPSGGSFSPLPHSPTTFRTHNNNGSIHSLPYDSAAGSISYVGTPPPIPPTTSTQPTTYANRQAVITPFTLQHNVSSSQDSSAHDRKRADSPDTVVTPATVVAPRARINPPAYSESPHDRGDFSSQAPDQMSSYGGSTSIMTTPRRPHEKSPSVDSIVSNTSGGHWTHANSGSLSGAADVLSQMDSASLPGPPAPNYPGPGPSTVLQYRDEKRRPTVMNATSDDTDSSDPPS